MYLYIYIHSYRQNLVHTKAITGWSWDVRHLHQTCITDGPFAVPTTSGSMLPRYMCSCRRTLGMCFFSFLSCLHQHARRVARPTNFQPLNSFTAVPCRCPNRCRPTPTLKHVRVHGRATPPQLLQPLRFEHVRAHGAASPNNLHNYYCS